MGGVFIFIFISIFILIFIFIIIFIFISIFIFICCHFKRKTKNISPGDFLNPSTVCLSSKRKFVVCPFVDEEPTGIYQFANGLYRLNGLNGGTKGTCPSMYISICLHTQKKIPIKYTVFLFSQHNQAQFCMSLAIVN